MCKNFQVVLESREMLNETEIPTMDVVKTAIYTLVCIVQFVPYVIILWVCLDFQLR